MNCFKEIIKKGIIIALMLVVGTTMSLGVTTDEVAAATKKPSKVTISEVKSYDYNAIKITWKKTTNAKKYQVYRATSKYGKYKLIRTTTSRSYVNTKLTTGKKYYYKVRGVNGSKKGKFSDKKYAVPKLKKVYGIKAASKNSNSTTVSWKKVNGTKGYQVYRATGKTGTYKKVKTTSSNSVTDTGLTAGKVYYYKIRSYRVVNSKTYYGTYSDSVRVQVKEKYKLAAPNIATKVRATGVYISWNSTANAEGYEIYRASNKTGTFEEVGYTSSNSYTDIIGFGKEYYYKVRACKYTDGECIYSDFSNIRYGRSAVNEKKISVDGVEFTISGSRTHDRVQLNTGGHISCGIDLKDKVIGTACVFDDSCQSRGLSISLKTDKVIDHNELKYMINNNSGYIGASQVTSLNGETIYDDEDVGSYHVVPNWEEPVAEVYAEYRPGMYIKHLVDIYFIDKGTFDIKIYYKNELLYEAVINNEYVDEAELEYRAFVKDIEERVWTDDMSNYDKLISFGKYIAENYSYEQIHCMKGASFLAYAARDLGLDTRYRFGYEDKYDYTSAYTIGGHTSTVVNVDGELKLFDVQGGTFNTLSNDFFD